MKDETIETGSLVKFRDVVEKKPESAWTGLVVSSGHVKAVVYWGEDFFWTHNVCDLILANECKTSLSVV